MPTSFGAFRLRPAVGLALLLALQTAAPAAATTSLGRNVNQRVAEAKRIAPALGVHVVDLETGREVYSYRKEEPRILASNTKLFTTAAALDRLGTEYVFETPILVRGTVYDGALAGDLAVVGAGDPNISGRFYEGDSYAVFRQWARALGKRGIRRVEGDVILVDGLFESERIHPDWPRDQLARWYEAPVGALSFSDNCVLVRVSPGNAPGRPAKVEIVPDLGFLEVESTAGTTSSVRRHRVLVDRASGSRQVMVAGSVYSRRKAPVEVWLTVPDPTEYFGAALVAAFEEEGIRITGRPRAERVLPGAVWERVTAHRSELAPTLAVVNKRSQNFYAESLLKALAAERRGRGSWANGVEEVESFLAGVGLDLEEIALADGSGMSRNNLATPRQVTGLLGHMYRHRLSRDFLRSLPFSGEDESSWERRLAEAPYAGNVVAKTGTLSGVSTLSGYARASSGKLYAFSILLNRTSSSWRARRAQDRILRALIDHG